MSDINDNDLYENIQHVKTSTVHVLRNPDGFSEEAIRMCRLMACDNLDAYESLIKKIKDVLIDMDPIRFRQFKQFGIILEAIKGFEKGEKK